VTGYLFIFVLRRRITREDGDECLFDFQPVFVRSDGVVDDAAVVMAVGRQAEEAKGTESPAAAGSSFEIAREHLQKTTNMWDWDEDVEFISMSWVIFQ